MFATTLLIIHIKFARQTLHWLVLDNKFVLNMTLKYKRNRTEIILQRAESAITK